MVVGILFSAQFKEKSWKMIFIPLFLLGLLISFSRSAWLALFISSLPLFYWQIKPQKSRSFDKKTNTLILILFIAVIGLFSPLILNRLLFQNSWSEFSGILSRGQLIKIALSAIYSNPFSGVGAGNFPVYMRQFVTFDLPHYVHNIPLLFASECGVVSGLLWTILWLTPVFQWSLKKHLIKNRYPLIAAWLAIGLIGLLDNYPVTLDNFRVISILVLILVIKERNETYP